jgi:hypothetical protein
MEIAIERITVTLGYLTLTSALAVFASCRTIPALLKRFGMKDPMSGQKFQAFYFLHPFFWRAFLLLVIVHLSLALTHLSMVMNAASVIHTHLVIIFFGLGTALSYAGMFASCRIVNAFIFKSFKPGSLSGRSYQVFNALHSYYWLLVLALIATHFYFGHADAGFWPTMGQ